VWCTRQNAKAVFSPLSVHILSYSAYFAVVLKNTQGCRDEAQTPTLERGQQLQEIYLLRPYSTIQKKRHYPSSISKGIISKQTHFSSPKGKRKYYILLSKSTSRRLRNLPNIHFLRLLFIFHTAILPLHLSIRLWPSKWNHSRCAPNR